MSSRTSVISEAINILTPGVINVDSSRDVYRDSFAVLLRAIGGGSRK